MRAQLTDEDDGKWEWKVFDSRTKKNTHTQTRTCTMKNREILHLHEATNTQAQHIQMLDRKWQCIQNIVEKPIKLSTLKQIQPVACRSNITLECCTFVSCALFRFVNAYVFRIHSICTMLHIYYNVEKHSSTKYLCEHQCVARWIVNISVVWIEKVLHSDSTQQATTSNNTNNTKKTMQRRDRKREQIHLKTSSVFDRISVANNCIAVKIWELRASFKL